MKYVPDVSLDLAADLLEAVPQMRHYLAHAGDRSLLHLLVNILCLHITVALSSTLASSSSNLQPDEAALVDAAGVEREVKLGR